MIKDLAFGVNVMLFVRIDEEGEGGCLSMPLSLGHTIKVPKKGELFEE